MFEIYFNNSSMWSPREKTKLMSDMNINLEVNKVGSFSFKIYPGHRLYNSFEELKTIITVLQDDEIIFRGRVFSDEGDFRAIKTIEVEGLLGFFNDSIVRNYEYSGSVSGYLEFLINQHNAQVETYQRFKLGTVTVTDRDNNDYIVRSSTQMPKTWNEITEKLINNLGGYIVLRYESDGNYIDYLEDFNVRSSQRIEYALNLMDLTTSRKADTIATCIIPLGAYSDSGDTRLDIKSVNDGKDYIYDAEAVAKYGKIYETVEYDDVTIASNLLAKGRLYLASKIKLLTQITIKAIDLHLSDERIASFRVGQYIKVYSIPHSLSDIVLLKAISFNLLEPTSSLITLGLSKESYVSSSNRSNAQIVQRVTSSTAAKVINNTQTYVDQVINSSAVTTTIENNVIAKLNAGTGWNTLSDVSSKIVTTGTAYVAPKYRKFNTHVHIRGCIGFTADLNVGEVLFTIPSGYRPSQLTTALVWANGELITLAVSTAGVVTVTSIVSLSGTTDRNNIAIAIDYFTD